MGAFFLIQRQSGQMRQQLADCLAQALTKQDFGPPLIIEHSDSVLYLYAQQLRPQEYQYLAIGLDDFCAVVGTVFYRGCYGQQALAHLYQDWPHLDLSQLYGAFCLIVRVQAHNHILIDRLGLYKVHQHDGIYCSSLLALVGLQTQPQVSSQAVYEYLFQGAVHGEASLFQHLELLSPDYHYHWYQGQAVKQRAPDGLVAGDQLSSFEQGIELNLERLRQLFAILSQFPGQIDTALSGGYDSRLLLALLLEQGRLPQLHVYGSDHERDVQIAQHICQAQSWPLDYVNEGSYPKISPEQFAVTVQQNLHRFDGLPVDGILNDGMDWFCRQQRGRHGALMLNGGGGEIYRNFFHLRHQSYSLRQLLWAFYAQHDAASCSSRFVESDYFGALEHKLQQTLGLNTNRISAEQLELVYPLFRCRYWMGRNNVINNRLGPAMTPFIDYSLVQAAAQVPLKHKYHGRFEAELIRRLNPSLAAFDSAYGYAFAASPPRLSRFSNWLHYLRPCWLRRYSYPLRHRRSSWRPSGYLAAEYFDAVLPEGWHYLPEFIDIHAIAEPGLWQRALTLEYVLQYVQAKLVHH